jgi:hypothetical protein
MPMVRERLLGGTFGGIMQVLDRKVVEQLAAAHESKAMDAAYPLYALVCIDSWMRQFRATI